MTVPGHPPGDDEFEVTLLGPGYGESVVLHIGGGVWILVDSCGRADAPAALEYLGGIGLDPALVVVLIVATHWHDERAGPLPSDPRPSLVWSAYLRLNGARVGRRDT